MTTDAPGLEPRGGRAGGGHAGGEHAGDGRAGDGRGRTPVAVALVAVWRPGAGGGEILLTRRSPAARHLPGLWELPGGKLRTGETTQSAARRELREETGLDLDDLETVAVVEHDYPERTVRLHAFFARLPEGALPAAGVDHRWVTIDDLPSVGLPAANAPITRAIVERCQSRKAGGNA